MSKHAFHKQIPLARKTNKVTVLKRGNFRRQRSEADDTCIVMYVLGSRYFQRLVN